LPFSSYITRKIIGDRGIVKIGFFSLKIRKI